MILRRNVFLVAALVLTSCSASASGQGPAPVGTVPGVGVLPSTIVDGSAPPVVATGTDPTSTSVATDASATTTTTTLPADLQIGARTTGNRVLLIGDSVLASTSHRYGDTMCQALVPLDWQVEVDAETSRFIEFGGKVLDSRLSAGWDTSVILLGNNYGGDPDDFRTKLSKMIYRLSPKPVVLLTVTEFRTTQAEVNAVIREMPATFPNVVILDWAASSGADPAALGPDGLHLTDEGRQLLATNVAFVMGRAGTSPGGCLRSNFTDDSGGSVRGGKNTGKNSPPPKPTPTTVGQPTPRPTTPTTPTTTKPTATTVPGSTATTQPTVTQPPATQPPATPPPATQPPAAQPPASQPPATQPPATQPPQPTQPPPPAS